MPSGCIICREQGDKGFFSFSRKPRHIRSAWIKSAKLSDFFLDNSSLTHRICFRHFSKNCFNFTEKNRIQLKRGALPSHKIITQELPTKPSENSSTDRVKIDFNNYYKIAVFVSRVNSFLISGPYQSLNYWGREGGGW